MIMKQGSNANGKHLIEKNERDRGTIHLSKQRNVGAAEGRPVLNFSFLPPPPFSHFECGKISLGELWDKST